jgi:hypothetical protein
MFSVAEFAAEKFCFGASGLLVEESEDCGAGLPPWQRR